MQGAAILWMRLAAPYFYVNPQERKPQVQRDWLDLLQGRAHDVYKMDVCACSFVWFRLFRPGESFAWGVYAYCVKADGGTARLRFISHNRRAQTGLARFGRGGM